MSNAFAIAAVTAVMKDILHNGFVAHDLSATLGEVSVSAIPPDRVIPSSGEDPNQLNLFLYQVTPNQGWRNVDLPSRDTRGERVANPPLALDLHYLLTAYGARDFHPEIVLGHAMQLLHENPIVTRDAIRRALSPSVLPEGFPASLATSDLAEQVEQIKITQEILSAEEISKLWSAFQAKYRATAAYLVTVVLIESRQSTRAALPVQARKLYVRPFHQPEIERIRSAAGPNEPITPASTLLIEGHRLRAKNVQVFANGIDLSAAIADVRDTRIELPLPAPLPAGMRAGVQAVQVAHPIDMGTPETPHRGFESNVEAFILRPSITPSVASTSDDGIVDGVTLKRGELQVTFTPAVDRKQRVTVFLNEFNAPASRPPHAHSFQAPTGNGIAGSGTETGSINFPYRKVAPGDYLVRVRVDGAESLLAADGSGQLAQPQITIP
ncbi:MAG TPA: DUF4255 domain-containing protein [Methylomirabilota bacterium]|nr:DUF4255 domain-containing protein [Methylomirabilota bacterium]